MRSRSPSLVEVRHRIPFSTQHVPMKKQKGIQGPILCRGSHVSVCGQVGQVFPNLRLPECTWVLGVVVLDVAHNPAEIGLLGLVGIALSATSSADTIQKGGRVF